MFTEACNLKVQLHVRNEIRFFTALVNAINIRKIEHITLFRNNLKYTDARKLFHRSIFNSLLDKNES